MVYRHVEMVVAKAKHGKATYNCILNLAFAKKRKKDYTTRHKTDDAQETTRDKTHPFKNSFLHQMHLP
jgi:hypothetical protein